MSVSENDRGADHGHDKANWLPDGMGGLVPLMSCANAVRREVDCAFRATRLTPGISGDREVEWMEIESDGRDVLVRLPSEDDGRPRCVIMRGDAPGGLRVLGTGEAQAIRRGSGDGDAVRAAGGSGSPGVAWRSGSGNGNAEVTGAGPGTARRSGTGHGHALALTRPASRVFRNGRGRGFALAQAEAGSGNDGQLRVDFCDPMADDDAARVRFSNWAGESPAHSGMPGWFSRPLAALADGLRVGGSVALVRAADGDDWTAISSAGRDAQSEWADLHCVADGVRGLARSIDLAEAGIDAGGSPGMWWTDFVQALGGEGWRSAYRMLCARLEREHVAADGEFELRVAWVARLAEPLACLEAIIERAGDDAACVLPASGYIRQAAAWAVEVGARPDCGAVRDAVSNAAQMARERMDGLRPGR